MMVFYGGFLKSVIVYFILFLPKRLFVMIYSAFVFNLTTLKLYRKLHWINFIFIGSKIDNRQAQMLLCGTVSHCLTL